MSEKAKKKQPEIPQPKPDIILPKNDGTAAIDPNVFIQSFSSQTEIKEEK